MSEFFILFTLLLGSVTSILNTNEINKQNGKASTSPALLDHQGIAKGWGVLIP